MPNLLRLEWQRDLDGYDLMVLDPSTVDFEFQGEEIDDIPFAMEGAPPETQLLIDKLELGFLKAQWQRETLLVPPERAVRRYNPLEEFPALFMEFAYIELAPAAVKVFADAYGLLHTRQGVEAIEDWYSEIRGMHTAVRMWRDAKNRDDRRKFVEAFNNRDRSNIHVLLESHIGVEHPTLHIKPNDLLSAMWLQLAQAVSANLNLRRCAQCPAWFTYGTGTGRRKSAHYCSDRCRKAASHGRKKEATR